VNVILTAGPMLDAQVARTLWRAIVIHDPETETSYLMGEDGREVPLPRFSRAVDDAHRVVALMNSRGWTMTLKQVTEGTPHWLCAFVRDDGRTYVHTKAETMPLAICIAALAAHRGQNVVP